MVGKAFFKGFVVTERIYCPNKHIAQYNHKDKQDAYESLEEVGFSSDWEERESFVELLIFQF